MQGAFQAGSVRLCARNAAQSHADVHAYAYACTLADAAGRAGLKGAVDAGKDASGGALKR